MDLDETDSSSDSETFVVIRAPSFLALYVAPAHSLTQNNL